MAQEGERRQHTFTLDDGVKAYGNGYRTSLFKYLDISYEDMQGKSVLEIGPADFPAIYFCKNLAPSYVIEPMDSPILSILAAQSGFTIIKEPAEECTYPNVDETWMFNVLTHVMSPDLIIDRAKSHSKIIRFFEPVYTGIGVEHPWSFTFDYFREKFGRCIRFYPPNEDAVNFHQHECVFGIYKK